MPYTDCQTRAHLTGFGVGLSSRERKSRVHALTLQRLWSNLHCEPWPEGMLALHHCDNPRCSNPAHIFPGTPSENTLDAYAKGRLKSGFGQGEGHHRAKLTSEAVAAIRRRVAEGETQRTIARDFKVNPSTISRVSRGERWRWLSSPT